MKITNLVSVIFLLISTISYSQFKIDAELRPRFEYRHGFKTLFPDNTDAASFVSQRTRLNTSFKMEKLDFFISFQNIRVWGDVPQLNSSDKNGIMFHQAWAKFNLNTNWAVKLGRQEIVYDDSRIFGNVGWAQQARSHDLAMFKYTKNNFKLDLGIAFNQDGQAITGTTLNTNTYKAFQYAWFHKTWANFSGSFLFLNNGLQFIDALNSSNNETRYSQTIGTHLKYGKNNLSLIGNIYYQFGNDRANNNLNAHLIGLEAKYKTSENTKLGLGFELQSGNDNATITNGKNNAFTPFFGTNHKFNGLMDYFYVGNHFNNVGLVDLYVNATFKLNKNSSLHTAYHNFSAAAEFNEKQLGSELDFVYSYKIQKYVSLKAGYSHLFPSSGMEILKGNSDGNTNNWGWVMVTIKPTLFTSTK